MCQRGCEASKNFAVLEDSNKVTRIRHEDVILDVQPVRDYHDLDNIFRIREITGIFFQPAPGLPLYRLEFHDVVIDEGRLQDRLRALQYMTSESHAAEITTIQTAWVSVRWKPCWVTWEAIGDGGVLEGCDNPRRVLWERIGCRFLDLLSMRDGFGIDWRWRDTWKWRKDCAELRNLTKSITVHVCTDKFCSECQKPLRHRVERTTSCILF